MPTWSPDASVPKPATKERLRSVARAPRAGYCPCVRNLTTKASLAAALLTTYVAVACGAKTGLLFDDPTPVDGGFDALDAGPDATPDATLDVGADVSPDVTPDVSPDVTPDAPPDVMPDVMPDVPLDVPDVCIPEDDILEREDAEVIFVVDRSNSMDLAIDGNDPGPGEDRRWDVMRDAFQLALTPNNDFLAIGVKMYPRPVPNPQTAGEQCEVTPGLDLAIAPNRVNAFVNLFSSTQPLGGTPTAPALETARQAFANRPDTGRPRFVVLATDGAPTCNPNAATPATCKCTWLPGTCDDPGVGPYLCLDETDTLSAISNTFAQDGIPVYVIGISDPNPLFIDMLNRMAIAGGRPLPNGPRRFYDVQQPSDMNDALVSITDSIARCVFRIPSLGQAEIGEVTVGNTAVPRDPNQQNGWDFTGPEEITLFGATCDAAANLSTVVRASTVCPDQ